MGKVIAYLLILAALCAWGVSGKRRRSAFAAIAVFMWVVIALCMDSYDIGNYRATYGTEFFLQKDALFGRIGRLFILLGIGFDWFKVFWGTGITVLLIAGLRRYTDRPALAGAMFLIVMTGYSTQMRSAMAGAILLLAFSFLLTERKQDAIWFTLLTLLASAIHIMAAGFLILLIPRFSCRRNESRWFIVCLIAAAVMAVVLRLSLDEIHALLIRIGQSSLPGPVRSLADRLILYFSPEIRPNGTGFLFYSLAHFGMTFAAEWACIVLLRLRGIRNAGYPGALFRRIDRVLCMPASPKRLVREQPPKHVEFWTVSALGTLRRMNAVMLLLIPLYAASEQFNRLFGYMQPLCICVFAQAVWESGKLRRRAALTALIVMFFALLFIAAMSVRSNVADFVRMINGIRLPRTA